MYHYALMYLIMYVIKQIKQLCYLLPRNYQIEKYSLKQRGNYFKIELFLRILGFIFQKAILR